jgi:hypothetical protein
VLKQVGLVGEFSRFDAEAPATLGAVGDAVTHLSALNEAKILELVSAGKVAELLALEPAGDQPIPSDTTAEGDLVEASASPLNRKQRDALIQSSLAATTRKKYRPRSVPKR